MRLLLRMEFVRVLLCMAIFAPRAVASEGGLVRGGNFEALDFWGEEEEGVGREIVAESSPIPPGDSPDQSSILLTGRGRKPHLVQHFSQPVTSGKIEFSMDFKLKASSGDEAGTGWGVALFDGINAAKTTAGFSASTRFRLQNDEGAGGKILLRSKFEPDVWYRFSATLDLDSGKWSGVLLDEFGNEETFFDETFQNTSAGTAEVGGIRIGPQGIFRSETTPAPLLVDRIAVKVLKD